MVFDHLITTHDMILIEGVYNVKEEVEARGEDHAARLIDRLRSLRFQPQSG